MTKRVAIIAFNYFTKGAVSALRPQYWSENLSSCDEKIICDVLTSQENLDNRTLPNNGEIITIVNTKKSLFSRFVNFDPGLDWAVNLKDFLKSTNSKYDVVIFTGSPFLHFSVAKICKAKFNCKVVMDFRDPFSNSPDHNPKLYKRWIKKMLERRFIKQADAIITVNEACAALLETNKKVHIIDNGFNEKTINNLPRRPSSKKIKIIYPGKFYPSYKAILPFIEIVHERKYEFFYFGSEYENIKHLRNDYFIPSKQLPQELMLDKMSNCNVGVILHTGAMHHSTTKIFDYIGMEMHILILCANEVTHGEIYDIVENYPNVEWCMNNKEDILRAFDAIKAKGEPKNFPQRMNYSRESGTKKVIEIINEIT